MNNARWVATAVVVVGCRPTPIQPSAAPRIVAASAGPVPANQALASTAVPRSRNLPTSSSAATATASVTNTTDTAAIAIAKRSGDGKVGNGYASANRVITVQQAYWHASAIPSVSRNGHATRLSVRRETGGAFGGGDL